MSKRKLPQEKTSLSGPIALPTRTLLFLGLLFIIVAITMLFYPQYWFSPIFKGSFFKSTVTVEKIWLKKSLTQCGEVWHQENIPLEDYFKNKQIVVYEMKYGETEGIGEIVCKACTCLSGYDLLIQIDKSDIGKLNEFEIIQN